ncbi:hypothetical protein B5K05_23725 [Rhizobium phaseoli]|nr:hypothetical protein B5K04_23660 [Rhizobium phaseoli]RDJ06949.1 hypothetical protein B5K05_23725 [Rhizobium phaseoli]
MREQVIGSGGCGQWRGDGDEHASGVVRQVEGQEGAALLLHPHQFPDLGKRVGRIGQVQAQAGSGYLPKMARRQRPEELGPALECVGIEGTGNRRLLLDVGTARAAATAVRRNQVFKGGRWWSLSP